MGDTGVPSMAHVRRQLDLHGLAQVQRVPTPEAHSRVLNPETDHEAMSHPETEQHLEGGQVRLGGHAAVRPDALERFAHRRRRHAHQRQRVRHKRKAHVFQLRWRQDGCLAAALQVVGHLPVQRNTKSLSTAFKGTDKIEWTQPPHI